MNDTKVMDQNTIAKWLMVVMYIAIVSLVNTLVSLLPFIPAAITTWISRGIIISMVVSMVQLAPANGRYMKAGIFRAVMLGLTIVSEVFHTGAVLTFAASILSIVAMYQEYHAHSELMEEKDHQLSGKWTSLFLWSILTGVIIGFSSTVAVMMIALTDMDVVKATAMIVAILGIPQYIIEVLYILYLKKMVALFAEDEVH